MDQAQLRCKARRMIFLGRAFKHGEIFWADTPYARQLIDAGLAETVGKAVPQAVAVEPAEKKSSAAALAGPSTASARSSEPGMAAPSSASEPAPVLLKRKRRSRKAAETLPGDPSASSPSTTPTE